MKYILFISTILISISAFPQDCTKELLLQKPGTWKDATSGSTDVPAADLLKEKKTVASIHAMIKSGYSPFGLKASFSGAYHGPQPFMPVYNYYYGILALTFYCEGNVVQTAGETPNSFYINANLFDSEIYDTAQGGRILLEGFNVIEGMPFQKNGIWCFKEKDIIITTTLKGKKNMWLITYDGKLPYSYVSKKEFLEKRKRSLHVLMQMSASGLIDVLKNNDITKGFKETEYKNDPKKMQLYMKMEYLSTKERYEKLLAANEKEYKPAFDKIENQLKMPEAELSRQAIVKIDPHDHLSYLFTDDKDPFGQILIKPNPGYFNKKLPKSTPQFFWVHVEGDHNDPIAAKFMADITKAVDFTTLKNMLGK